MNSTELIKLIHKFNRDHKKKIFSLREISCFANEKSSSVGMALIRARKKGIVDRARNLWINMMDKPSLEEVALELVSPSYISFESALYKHGILSQSPRGLLTLATTKKPSRVKTPVGDIQYIHLQPKLFFSFDAMRFATPEKAFLDLIYIRKRRGIYKLSEVFYLDLLKRRILLSLAKRFPKYVEGAMQVLR